MKKAILLFLLIIVIIPFYESKRVLMWGIESEAQNENIFRYLVLLYAQKAEEIKTIFSLDRFFEKEQDFWQRMKESPEPETNLESEKGTEEKEILPKAILGPGSSPRVLLMGDSFMAVWGGVGDILERELLKYQDIFVLREGKVSSGLSRPDYFDWPSEAEKLISQHDFNTVVVMLGSNDAQSLTNSEGRYIINYGTEDWNRQYSERVSGLLSLFDKNGLVVFWVGFPIMKGEKYSQKMNNLNSIYEKECQNYENAYFISTWELFTDAQRNYTAYLPDENGKYKLARLSDGIHLTYFGGTIVVEEIIQHIRQVLKF